ncbi:MAG: hypothetical protein ACFFG0_27985 [Candidatus Thorarchaeota archaeon]
MSQSREAPKTGYDKIIEYFNNSVEKNHPIAIAKVVEDLGFSWSFVKKTLAKIVNEFEAFHFEKSGNTWIIWKDRDHLIKKLDETCSSLLDDSKDGD